MAAIMPLSPFKGKRIRDDYCTTTSVAVASLLITHNRLRSGSAEFKLYVHFLQARSQRFNLLLLRLNLATCFEKLIEQHRVHRVVAEGIKPSHRCRASPDRVDLFHLLGHEAELRDALGIDLFVVMEGDRF
jgi:hypothetical protein